MNAKIGSSVEHNGPNINALVSCQVMLDVSKLKAVIPCAPAKIGAGFKVGVAGKTKLKGAGSAQANLKDTLLHGGVTGVLGARGEGTIHGGTFALYNDKAVSADGALHGVAGAKAKSGLKADLGVKDGKRVVQADKHLTGVGEYDGAATVRLSTGDDALAYVQGNRIATLNPKIN